MTIETKYNVGDKVWFDSPVGGIMTGTIDAIAYASINEKMQIGYRMDGKFSGLVAEDMVCPTVDEMRKRFDSNK